MLSRPERHGADGLDAAQAIDLIGAGQMLGRDDGRRRPAVIGRRAGLDMGHARHLGGDDRHMGRGQQRIFAARHIAAHGIHRDVLVAEDDARQGLDLEIEQAGLLLLREIAHLGLGEADVVDVLGRELGEAALDLRIGQAEILAAPIVEFLGELPHGRIAARSDVGQDPFDDGTDLGIVLGGRRPALAFFQFSHLDVPSGS